MSESVKQEMLELTEYLKDAKFNDFPSLKFIAYLRRALVDAGVPPTSAEGMALNISVEISDEYNDDEFLKKIAKNYAVFLKNSNDYLKDYFLTTDPIQYAKFLEISIK